MHEETYTATYFFERAIKTHACMQACSNAGIAELHDQAVCAWAIHTFGQTLDGAKMWLNEAAADKAVNAGLLYIQAYVALANDCLQKFVPRYKVRPKCHSFHCETVLRIQGGSRANPRFFSCFNDEDYVGRTCSVGKQSVHPLTLAKRVLERLLMHTNAWLTEKAW